MTSVSNVSFFFRQSSVYFSTYLLNSDRKSVKMFLKRKGIFDYLIMTFWFDISVAQGNALNFYCLT